MKKKTVLLMVLALFALFSAYAQNTAQAAIAAYNRGVDASEARNYDRAIADYTQVIRLDSNYWQAYFNRGRAYLLKSDYDRAIADSEAVLRINPDYELVKIIIQTARLG